MMDGAAQPSEDDEDIDAAESLLLLYKSCVDKFGWSLREIDETDLETLLDFLFLKTKPNKNIRVIDGKTYTRATTPPSWL